MIEDENEVIQINENWKHQSSLKEKIVNITSSDVSEYYSDESDSISDGSLETNRS